MVHTKRIVSSSLWAAGTSYAFFGLNFVGQIFLARFLLPSDFGLYAFVFSIKGIAGLALGFTFNMAFVQSAGRKSHFNALVWLNIFVGFIYVLIGIIGVPILLHYKTTVAGLVFLVSCCSQILSGVGQAYLAPFEKEFLFRNPSLIAGTATAASTVICVVFAMLGCGIWSLALREVIYGLLLLLLAAHNCPLHFEWQWNAAELREILTFAGKTSISRGFEQLFFRIQNILVGNFMGNAFLGHFAQAQYLGVLPNAMLAFFTTKVSFTFLANLNNEHHKIGIGLFWTNYLTIRAAFPASLVALACGPQLVSLLFGANWGIAGALFQNMSLFLLVLPVFGNIFSACYALSRQRWVSEAYLAASCVFTAVAVLAWRTGEILLLGWGLGCAIILAGSILLFHLSRIGIPLNTRALLLWPAVLFTADLFAVRLVLHLPTRLAVVGASLAALLLLERKNFSYLLSVLKRGLSSGNGERDNLAQLDHVVLRESLYSDIRAQDRV